MIATISKWGNSQGLRLPKAVMDNLHIEIGDQVNIVVVNKTVVLEPIVNSPVKYKLKDLLNQLPQDYQVSEVFTESQGSEQW